MKLPVQLRRHWPLIVVAVAFILFVVPVILVLFPGHTDYVVIKP